MLNLQWVIKRPQLEKRSAWISIYLLINSECAFVNFIVQGPSLVWDSLLWNSNVLHSAQTNISSWHCALWRTLSSKCGYMQASDKVERWLGLWTYRFWKNRDTGSRVKRCSVLILWHTHETRHMPADSTCPLPGYAWLWQDCWEPLYPTLHYQGCWLQC